MHARPQTVCPTPDLDRPVPDPSRPHRIRQLEDSITELAAHIDAATCHWLELVREYDDSGAWAGPGLKSCAHWLNWKCGLRLGAARERVRVAHALHTLPAIREAFREGRVSYSKVRAMSRVATPATEERLLRIALCGTATHVERVVQQFRRARRTEALAEENRRHELRELHWCIDSDGCFVLRGRFTPEQGAVIRKALDTVLEEQFAEHEHVPAGTIDAGGPAGSSDCLPSVASRRADALAHIAGVALEDAANRAAGPADRFLVHVHASIDALREDGSGAEAAVDGAGHVSAESARRLACDASVVHWLDGAAGEPLGVGRKTRTVPPAIRRVLQRRDGGCRFPGCSATRFVDAHHIHHWADGGETHLGNLVLLCRHHHRLVHEGGFGLERVPGGAFRFTSPDGKAILDCPELRSRGNVLFLRRLNDSNGVRISPKTPVPAWYGEHLDYQIALSGLGRCD